MHGQLLKGVLVSTKNENNEIKKSEMVDELHEIYKTLDCGCIDIITAKINGIVVDLIFDDNGKYSEDKKYKVAVLLTSHKQIYDYIVGNVFICKGNNETGELESLSDEEIKQILKADFDIELNPVIGTTRRVLVAEYL